MKRRHEWAMAGRPWLWPIESTVDYIPQRLAEIDPDLFLVLNVKSQQFEVHDAAVPIPALTRVLEAEELDLRIVQRVRAAAHDREPFAAAERWGAEERAAMDRKTARDMRALAGDVADAIRYDVHGRQVFTKGGG